MQCGYKARLTFLSSFSFFPFNLILLQPTLYVTMFYFLIQLLQLISLFSQCQSSHPSATNLSMTSSMSSQAGTLLDGLDCNNCGRFAKFLPCKSNKNGNRGVFFATCHAANDKGEKCTFIRRASRSPSASPTLPFQATFPDPILVAPPAQTTSRCPVSGCGQTRLADDCPRHICRKHCIEQGGCTSKKHKSSVSMAASLVPLSSTSSAAVSAQPLLSVPSPSVDTSSPSANLVDARADPRFATHLLPIFTEAIAEQQEKSRQQSILDAQRKENAQKSKQRVVIYPWTTENTAPTIKLFQNFPWPYLTITSNLLATVGLLDASKRGDLRMYDELDVLDWVAVDVGHVLEVCDGQRLFLKDASIRNCIEFQKSLDSHPRRSAPHLHKQLPRERAYVREMLKTASPPSSPRLHSLPASSSSSIVLPSNTEPTPSPLATEPTPSPLHSQLPSSSEKISGTGGPSDPIVLIGKDSEKQWPSDYYTVDIGYCMRECSSRTQRHHQHAATQRSVFMKHFPNVRFVPSTFSNQRDLWNKAPGSLRDEFMELGRQKEGLWSIFARRARRARKVVDIIEID